MSDARLPEAFADLRHLGEWIVPTEEGRHRRKIAADIETARSFYRTVFPRMEAIIQHLNGVAWESMGPADRNLFLLASMCMEVSHPVELGWLPRHDTPFALPMSPFFLTSGRRKCSFGTSSSDGY